MPKYTFVTLAENVLIEVGNPMSPQEIWEFAKAKGLDVHLNSKGQTPWATLGARLYVSTKTDPNTPFTKVGKSPVKFVLRDIKQSKENVKNALLLTVDPVPEETDAFESKEQSISKQSKYPYKERELHPFVVRFAHFGFKGAYCKTISHENSSKKNFNEWLHPDLVGFWYPFKDYNKALLDLSGKGLSIAKFYSFELKRELTFANLRESYFQAVSNSSWANEGYLVAANIDESESLRDELSRLAGSFGIGVIELDLKEPERSTVLFPGRYKETIDWNGANKLAKENPDFQKFLADFCIDISNTRVHESEFDAIPTLDNLKVLWTKWHPEISANITGDPNEPLVKPAPLAKKNTKTAKPAPASNKKPVAKIDALLINHKDEDGNSAI